MADEDIPQTRPIVTQAEAIALGLERYFTGKPCGRGHLSERSTKWRACLECQSLKHQEWRKAHPEREREHRRKAYHKDIEASRAELRRRKQENPDLWREYAKRTYTNNKEKHLERAKARYAADPKRYNKQTEKWNQRNREKRRSIARKWAELNKEAMREWRAANPEKIRVYSAANKARRKSRIQESGGTFTKADIDRIFKAQKGRCAYCRTSLKDGYHIDHIQPLAKSGSNRPRNLQLCCDDCNFRKNARDPLEYARSTGRLL